MIYGENDAFLRLQQHIIQKSKDESIFAWDMECSDNTRIFSGLFASSPSAYAHCSDIIQTQGSRGFSESNGELSIPLRLHPHRSQTYYAILNCTDKFYPDAKVFIYLAKTAIEGNYVRIRDEESGNRGLMKSGHRNSSKERQIRVSVDSTDPPLSIYYGFWLRTIRPPDYDKCQMTILSNDRTSEADYICQHYYDQGVAGIVRMKPEIERNNHGLFKIGWITFSFDEEFNPILWVADYAKNPYLDLGCNGHRIAPYDLHRTFPYVVTHGNKSQQHQVLMKSCKGFAATCEEGWPEFNGKLSAWEKWASVFKVDRENGSHQIKLIPSLNLKISVELQQQCSPADDSGRSTNHMSVWVVDITDTGGESPERRYSRATWSRRFGNGMTVAVILFILLTALVVISATTIGRGYRSL